MAIKFTEREMIGIRRKLKDYARRTVVHTSMQKITIGDLAKAAGISQSAFYKFYDSKELLFFEIMEDMHSDLAENMNKSLLESSGLPPQERLVQAMRSAICYMDEIELMRFFQEDVPVILMKMPQEILDKHYHSHDVHIRNALKGSGIEIKVPDDVLSSLIHILAYSLIHKEDCGRQYDLALDVLIRSAGEYVLTGRVPGGG